MEYLKLYKMSKNLVYFTVGYNPEYLQLTKLCVNTLLQFTNDIDIMVMCDSEFKPFVEKALPMVNIHLTNENKSAVESSMRKLEIFNYKNVDMYKNILYLDSDIVVCGDLNVIIDRELEDGILYVKKETDNTERLRDLTFGLCKYTEEDMRMFKETNRHPFSAGHFLFKNGNMMREHFKNIITFISSWNDRYFYEQSFLNHYFQLNGQYNDILLEPYIDFYDGIYFKEIRNSSYIVHCLKENFTVNKKMNNMKNTFSYKTQVSGNRVL